MEQLRARDYDPSLASAGSARLRQRHSEYILDLMRDGISMRTIRRHRLDDPRITDAMRTMLVEAAKERQSKAWFQRPDYQRAEERLATVIRLGRSSGTIQRKLRVRLFKGIVSQRVWSPTDWR